MLHRAIIHPMSRLMNYLSVSHPSMSHLSIALGLMGALLLTGPTPVSAQTNPTVAINVTDDTGQELHFEHAPQRIVSLAPSVTENLFAIGLGERVVGVSSYSDYPEPAKKLPIISDYQNMDLEAIAKLKPDVVVVWHGGQSPAQLSALKQLNIPIFYQKINTLADIPLSLMRLSQMAGNQVQAAPIIAQAYKQIPLLAQAPQPTLKVFYQVWQRPLMTINGSSWISDALARCGAANLYAELPISAPTVNLEDVLARQPELILSTTSNSASDRSLDFWRDWPQIPAVKHNGLIYSEGDGMNRSSLRTLAAAQQLCGQIAQVRSSYQSK